MRKQIITPGFLSYRSINNAENTKNGLNYWFYSSSNVFSGIILHPRKSEKEERIETEGPLSEKDEVKKAEQRTMEQQKKVEKQKQEKPKK